MGFRIFIIVPLLCPALGLAAFDGFSTVNTSNFVSLSASIDKQQHLLKLMGEKEGTKKRMQIGIYKIGDELQEALRQAATLSAEAEKSFKVLNLSVQNTTYPIPEFLLKPPTNASHDGDAMDIRRILMRVRVPDIKTMEWNELIHNISIPDPPDVDSASLSQKNETLETRQEMLAPVTSAVPASFLADRMSSLIGAAVDAGRRFTGPLGANLTSQKINWLTENFGRLKKVPQTSTSPTATVEKPKP